MNSLSPFRKSEGARIVKLHSRHAQETRGHPPLVEGTMDAARAQEIIIWSITEKLEWWYRVKVNVSVAVEKMLLAKWSFHTSRDQSDTEIDEEASDISAYVSAQYEHLHTILCVAWKT